MANKIIHYDFMGMGARIEKMNEITNEMIRVYEKAKAEHPELSVKEVQELPECKALEPMMDEVDKLQNEFIFWTGKEGRKWVEYL